MSLINRIKSGWNVFTSSEQKARENPPPPFGYSNFSRPGRGNRVFQTANGKDVTNSIYTRMAVDFANVDIRHVRLDKNRRFEAVVDSGLGNCLSLEANIDQSAWAFRQDIAQTLLEFGSIAIVPISTDDGEDPEDKDGVKINTARVATITQWFPEEIMVDLYDDRIGRSREIRIPKSIAAIVENPFHSTMNSPNSTLKRLVRKISLLDAVDEQIGAGKLDLIIQLPYVLKSETKKEQAEKRRADMEHQLSTSQYGVAYADSLEKIIQLNRPVENNLLKNVEAMTNLLYTELGITEEVLNGTADETTMLNYQTRIIKPLLKAVTEAMRRRFLSKTARTQGQSIEYYLDPFSLVPVGKIADIADKLSRNAILSANEMRSILGFPPSDDEMADKLVNKNMPVPEESEPIEP